jgi:tetratricopeptide (TPR) repeat protein
VSLHWAGALRDLVEVWNWAIELAADPRLVDHPQGASALGAASEAMWLSGGDLAGARSLAVRGLALADEHDTESRQRCLHGLGAAEFFAGQFEDAAASFLEGGEGAPWQEVRRTEAGLALAYAHRLDEARALNQHGDDASCPSALAWHHYVDGEIDNLDRTPTSAQHHYRECLRLSEISGATFLHAVAAVGLVSVQAAAGEVQMALRGYDELVDYWERTGAWTQQWTTLRNLANLLDRLDDHDAASFLRTAAGEAPEASSITPVDPQTVTARIDPSPDTRYASAVHTREQVLMVARESIARHIRATVEG